MQYTVQPGDSLWRIARRHYGNGALWTRIARDNRLSDPGHLLVGQRLLLSASASRPGVSGRSTGGMLGPMTFAPSYGWNGSSLFGPLANGQQEALIPAVPYVFVLADEWDPRRAKVVRRVLVSPKMLAEASRSLGRPLQLFPNPERFGFMPTGPASKLSAGRHALGMKPSPFSSASTWRFGAERFVGQPFWIDVAKARAAGATIHETSEILADLDRIAAKSASTADKAKIEAIKRLVAQDAEVLVKGPVPAGAIKGSTAMALTRGMQGVQIVGFAMTAVNVSHAAEKSVRTQSAKPLAAEAVRQVGGWASAWAGAKLGAAGGALLGIETGPGAIITGAVGGIVGGVAGYYGFDWIADHIDEN